MMCFIDLKIEEYFGNKEYFGSFSNPCHEVLEFAHAK
jgi:hypothetical protein